MKSVIKIIIYVLKIVQKNFECFISKRNAHGTFWNLQSTAVEQVVARALVTQRARVRSPVGTGFLGEVFSGFSSPVRQMSGNFRPQGPRISFGRRNHHSIFAMLGWLSVCLVCIVFHVCAVSEVAPALGWSLIRGGSPCPCVVKKVLCDP